ncbi:putative transcription factor Nin-like family [Helianthus debilis subsp. tardiflorus]
MFVGLIRMLTTYNILEYIIWVYIEPILSTLNSCLPNFKFANGEDVVSETDVTVVVKKNDTEEKIKLFQGRRKLKAAKKELTKEAVEKEFGKEIKDAYKSIGVCERTLRSYCREIGILKWSGPNFTRKMQRDPSLKIYIEKEDKGVASRVETLETNTDILVTPKAKSGRDMIKFILPIQEVSLAAINTEIKKRFEGLGSYKVKYMDAEDKEWYLMAHDDDIRGYIKSLKSKKKVVEMSIESTEVCLEYINMFFYGLLIFVMCSNVIPNIGVHNLYRIKCDP